MNGKFNFHSRVFFHLNYIRFIMIWKFFIGAAVFFLLLAATLGVITGIKHDEWSSSTLQVMIAAIAFSTFNCGFLLWVSWFDLRPIEKELKLFRDKEES